MGGAPEIGEFLFLVYVLFRNQGLIVEELLVEGGEHVVCSLHLCDPLLLVLDLYLQNGAFLPLKLLLPEAWHGNSLLWVRLLAINMLSLLCMDDWRRGLQVM